MELTWLAIAASLLMGFGAALLFFYAVEKGWLKDIEDVKYQVFWSDFDELAGVKVARSQRSVHGDQLTKKR
jgi:hypothetical protein